MNDIEVGKSLHSLIYPTAPEQQQHSAKSSSQTKINTLSHIERMLAQTKNIDENSLERQKIARIKQEVIDGNYQINFPDLVVNMMLEVGFEE